MPTDAEVRADAVPAVDRVRWWRGRAFVGLASFFLGLGSGVLLHRALVKPTVIVRTIASPSEAPRVAASSLDDITQEVSDHAASDAAALPPRPTSPVAVSPRRPRLSPPAAASRRPVVVPTADLEAEEILIETARSALRNHNESLALDTLAEHARRFPRGQFAELREALHVQALARGGRAAESRDAAAAFRVRHPNSAYERLVQDALRWNP